MFLQNLLRFAGRGRYPREPAPPRDAECVLYVLIHNRVPGSCQVTNF